MSDWFPHKISEGVVIKLLNGVYTAPQNPNWAKYKEKYEIDNLIYGIHEIIREGKKTDNYNYNLCAGPISEEWANAILAKDKKVAIQYKGKWYLALGKSDNTKVKCGIGDIIRTAAEDVNKYETDDPRYPYYKTYVAVVLAPVPEKNVPDKPFVLERLSEFTPRRETFVEKGIKDDIKVSIEEGKIPKEIYKLYAKENEPLPKEFYNSPREGEAFAQTHIRGLEPEDVENYKKKKISLAELFAKHSIHIDLRMKLGEKKLIQWVITAENTEKYLRMLGGEYEETATGVKQPTKAMAIVKPSAEEPEMKEIKKTEELKEPSISEKGAKLLEEIQIPGGYFIAPGEVGSSEYKFAYMGLMWKGRVKTGVARKDYHELFLFPDSGLPPKNRELLNGIFVIKAFKRPKGEGNYWQIWEATAGFPADPILHKDSGYHYPVPAEDLKVIGREHYQYGRKEPV